MVECPRCPDTPSNQRNDFHGIRGCDHVHEVVAGQLKKALFTTGETGVKGSLGKDYLEDAGSHKGKAKLR